MAANTRTPRQRELDLVALAEMYLRGLPQYLIAEQLHVSRQQVAYDIRALRLRWKKSADTDFATKVAQEVARLNHLETVLWETWDKSCEVAEDGIGDKSFLEQVQSCIDLRMRAMGIGKLDKHGGSVEEVTIRRYIGVDVDEV
jgi:hypothetical protein